MKRQKIVKLTQAENGKTPIYITLPVAAMFCRPAFKDFGGPRVPHTVLLLNNGISYCVVETPEEIMQLPNLMT